MKWLVLLAAGFVTGCDPVSPRDEIAKEIESIEKRLGAVESGLAAVREDISAVLLTLVREKGNSELRDGFAEDVIDATKRIEELDSGIAARERKLEELQSSADELLAKKQQLLQMVAEITQAHDDLQSKQGMDVELGIVTARGLRIVNTTGGTVVTAGAGQDGDGVFAVLNKAGRFVITVGADPSGTSEPQCTKEMTTSEDEVANLSARQRFVSQVVVAFDEFVPQRRLR